MNSKFRIVTRATIFVYWVEFVYSSLTFHHNLQLNSSDLIQISKGNGHSYISSKETKDVGYFAIPKKFDLNGNHVPVNFFNHFQGKFSDKLS